MARNFLFIIFSIGIYSTVIAQESVNSTGGDFSGSGGNVSFSIGQTFFRSDSTSAGSVFQGVQQVYEIVNVSIPDDSSHIDLKCNVFPNPSTGLLTLTSEQLTEKNISYRISDLQNKFLRSSVIVSDVTYIDMSEFSSGTYFINVVYNSDRSVIKSFKIIKK